MKFFSKDPKKEVKQLLISFFNNDGQISEQDKNLVERKASELGLSDTDFQLIFRDIERQFVKQAEDEGDVPADGFEISDNELLMRVQKWVNLCKEKSAKVDVESFPHNRKDATALEAMLNKGGNIVKELASVGNKAASKATSIALMVPLFVPGTLMVSLASGLLSGLTSGERKLEHLEIVEIAKKYLMILEIRSNQNPFLKQKFDSFLLELNNNIEIANRVIKKKFPFF